MKSSSASSRFAVLLAAALAGGPAFAGTPAEGLACLERSDLACAEAAGAGMGDSAAATRFRAELAFHRGEFADAAQLLESVAESEDDRRLLALYRDTVAATEGFATRTRGDVTIRYLPGVDEVLLDEAFETLQAVHDRIGPRLGGAPPGGVRLEIYPTGDRFTAASGIGAASVENTGVVALSKWTRLLVTSPRALARGYGWRDTLAHEYIHYIIAYNTRDNAPVWLQEGVARSHEVLWRDDRLAELPAYSQSLLAEALRTDSFVTLEEMHPSMAYLPSAERAALAFAQVSTMIEYLEKTAGGDATRRVLARVRDGADALAAVAAEASGGDPQRFMAGWRDHVGTLRLVSKKLAVAPTVLGGGPDDFGIDPVLARRQDLAGHARIGDLMQEQGLHDAALVEYRAASPADEPPSPLLSVRIARSLAALGRVDEAIRALETTIADYPDYATPTKELAALMVARGRAGDALRWYRASADINPFDPEVQGQLATLYASAGQAALAERHRGYRRLLLLGGSDPVRRPGGDG